MNDTFSMFRRRRSNLALDDLVSQTLVGWIRIMILKQLPACY